MFADGAPVADQQDSGHRANEATERSRSAVAAAQVGQSIPSAGSAAELDVLDDPPGPAGSSQRDRAWLEQPGAQPARRVGQHRAPLACRAIEPSGERPARRRRDPREGVGQLPVLPAEQVHGEAWPGAGRPTSRSASAESSSSSPSTSARLAVGDQERREGPAGPGGRVGRGPDADRRGIRPRNRRSGSRSGSGVANGMAGVDGHRASLTHDARSASDPYRMSGAPCSRGAGVGPGERRRVV